MEQSPNEERSTSNPVGDEGVYKARKLDFVEHFVNTLSIFGYVAIILQHIKFESSFVILLLRIFFHSLLGNPYPAELQLRRLAARTRSRPATNPAVAMPGGFTTMLNGSNATPTDSNTESDSQEPRESDIIILKRKIRTFLFHGSLTFNAAIFLWNIFHPTHFMAKLEGEYLHETDLKNAPSPFISGNGIIGGEMRGQMFLQIIGEVVPKSDLWGNINKSFYDFLILILQFTLFAVTCVIHGDMGYEESPDDKWKVSDGYDGSVQAVEIDYDNVLRLMIHGDDTNGTLTDNEIV